MLNASASSFKQTWLGRLLSLGIQPEMTWRDTDRLRLFNQVQLILFFILLVLSGTSFYFGNPSGGALALIMLLLPVVSLWLIYEGKYSIARWGNLFSLGGGICLISVQYGWGIGTATCFLTLSLGIILFFDTWRNRGFALALMLILFVGTDAYLVAVGPLTTANQERLILIVVSALNFLTMGMLISYFIYQDERFEQQRQELFENLEQRNQDLAQANNELAQFAAATSHHFQSPLKNVTNLLGLVQRKLPDHYPQRDRVLFGMVIKDARYLYHLVGDILSYSRLEDKAQPGVTIQPNETSVPKVLGRLQTLTQEKDGRVHVGQLPEVPLPPEKAERLLTILVENGLRYNESTPPQVWLSGEKKADGSVYLTVRDNGIGIKPRYHEQIFEMFNRLHNQEEYEGTGIGLSMCEKIVRMYGGHIQVDSDEGQGATFTVVLPGFHPEAFPVPSPLYAVSQS